MSFFFSSKSKPVGGGSGSSGSIKKRTSYEQVKTSDTEVDVESDGVFRDDDDDDDDDDDVGKGTSSSSSSQTFSLVTTNNNSNNNVVSTTTTTTTIYRLMEMARPERRLMIFSAVSMALGSAVSLAVPYYSGRIIDLSLLQEGGTNNNGDDGNEQNVEASSSLDSNGPFRLLMNLLAIMTLAGVAGFFRTLWQAQAGHRLVARLRRQLYRGILSQDASYFDVTPQGDLISRLSSDADLVQSAVTDQVLGLLRNVVIAMGAVGLLFYTSVQLALISIAILPPIALTARWVGRNMKDRQKHVRELHADATSLAEQALTCIRTVQQFATEQFEADQYNNAINQAHAEGIANTRLKALFGSVMQLVVNLALLCVLGYGGRLVQKGELTPGDLAGFVMYSVMMGGNVSGISTQYIDLMKAAAAAHRVFEIIDRIPSIPPPIIHESAESERLTETMITKPKAAANEAACRTSLVEMMEIHQDLYGKATPHGSTVGPTDGRPPTPLSIQFKNVSFAYPTRSESKVLKGLNLNVPAGKVIALVGGSGAGKSTIASLLTRLYDPQAGTISFNTFDNHQSLRDMNPQEIRQKVGIVVQEPLLFPTTIEANIRYGSPKATFEEVREAARLAYVLEFADQFSDGLQTVVGPRGTQLSGGQKQRVAVARCILKNPPIVVFDEATSALDAESESQVQKAIDTACKGRTVIMIAHRLSTIRSADAIAVLLDGQVAEMGSFDELMEEKENHRSAIANQGPFRQLMEKQLLVR